MNQKYFKGALNIAITIFTLALLVTGLNSIYNIELEKYFLIAIIYILISILLIRIYFTKNKLIYNSLQLICIISNIIMFYNIIELNKNYSYIENIITNKYEYKTYNVYVLKSTKYNSIKELNNKKIGILKENKNNLKTIINTKIDVNYIEYNNEQELQHDIENGIIQSYIIENSNNNKIRKIDTIKIKKTK